MILRDPMSPLALYIFSVKITMNLICTLSPLLFGPKVELFDVQLQILVYNILLSRAGRFRTGYYNVCQIKQHIERVLKCYFSTSVNQKCYNSLLLCSSFSSTMAKLLTCMSLMRWFGNGQHRQEFKLWQKIWVGLI